MHTRQVYSSPYQQTNLSCSKHKLKFKHSLAVLYKHPAFHLALYDVKTLQMCSKLWWWWLLKVLLLPLNTLLFKPLLDELKTGLFPWETNIWCRLWCTAVDSTVSTINVYTSRMQRLQHVRTDYMICYCPLTSVDGLLHAFGCLSQKLRTSSWKNICFFFKQGKCVKHIPFLTKIQLGGDVTWGQQVWWGGMFVLSTVISHFGL